MGKDDNTREMYLTLCLPGSAPGVILKQYARSQGELSLGRAAKSDSSAAALDTPKFRNDKTRVMSNKHARLAWNGNTPTITDVGSTNGVRIRQVDDPASLYECKVGVAYRINSGDTIVFGKPIQDPDQSGEVMCQPLEVVANVTPAPTVPLSKAKLTQAGRPDSAPLERVPTIGYSRRGPLIHGFVKETVEQPQTQSDRRRAPLSTLIKERYIQQPSSQPESRPRPLSIFLSNAAVEAERAALQQQQELKPDRPLPPLANLADPAPDYLKPHSRSTGFGLTDTDVCVSLDNTDDEAERKPAFVGISRGGVDEMLPASGGVDPLAKPFETSSKESFALPEKGAEQQAVVDGDDTEMPRKTTQEDKPNVPEVENAPLTAFQRMVIERLERRTAPPGPLDPSNPRQLDDAPAAVEVARKVTIWEVASQASHLPSPVSSDHEAEAREQEKHLDHDAEADQANDLAIDMYLDALLELDNLSSESRGRALHPAEQRDQSTSSKVERDQSTSSKVERDIGGEVATGQAGAELLLSPAPEPLVAAEIAFSEPSVFLRPVDTAEQDQAEPDLQAEDIDLAPIPVSIQDEKDRLVSRWRAGLDQAVGEGDGPSQERLQEDNNVRALDATQEEKDKLIARWHAELAQVDDGDSDQLAGKSGEEYEAAAGLDEYDDEHDGIVKGSRQPDAEEDDAVFDLDEYDRLAKNKQGARSDQGSDIVDDSAFMDEEAHDYAEAAGEAELPIGGAAEEQSSSPAEEALYEDEGSDARPSAHDSEAEVEHEIEEDEDDEFEVEVEDAFEVDEEEDFEVDDEEDFEVDGQEHFEVDAEGDFFDAVDLSCSEHDQQDDDDEQQPFEEARAFLDVIDQKEPRLTAVLLKVLKDLAENPINLDDMYDDDDASASDARSASSRVDDDDEEQEEADVYENNSTYAESYDRVDESLEDGEDDLQEEVDEQLSYASGDPAGDDDDVSEEGFRVRVQDLPEKANSEVDASELDPESPLRLRKRRFSDIDSDGLTDWLERENSDTAAQEPVTSNENDVDSPAPTDQGNSKRRRLSFPFKSFTIGVLTGVVGAVAGLTACDSLLGPA